MRKKVRKKERKKERKKVTIRLLSHDLHAFECVCVCVCVCVCEWDIWLQYIVKHPAEADKLLS